MDPEDDVPIGNSFGRGGQLTPLRPDSALLDFGGRRRGSPT